MADQEQLELLKQGVTDWNDWRTQHPEINPDLSGAVLSGADLDEANLRRADLSEADLSGAVLIETNLREATIIGCSIYGISVWNIGLEGAKQIDLVITEKYEPIITVDNLEVAQFIEVYP
jgi:hypothetical protein